MQMAKIDVEEAVTRIKAAAEAHKAAKEERSAKQHREALPQGHSWVKNLSAHGTSRTLYFTSAALPYSLLWPVHFVNGAVCKQKLGTRAQCAPSKPGMRVSVAHYNSIHTATLSETF